MYRTGLISKMESQQINSAYDNACKAFKEGITSTESITYYTEWCRSGGYEKDVLKGDTYNGPIVAGEAIKRLFPDTDNVYILDIAAGTGYVGEELLIRGFDRIDALDPSEGMLELARKKNIYCNYLCDILGGTTSVIQDDAYDCTVVCGAMGEGHIPCSGLNEMIRVVKPGGVVCIVMREEYLECVKEYENRLEPLMEKLEKEAKWKKIERLIFPNYFMGKNGVMYLFRVNCEGA